MYAQTICIDIPKTNNENLCSLLLMVYGSKLHHLGYNITPDWPTSTSEGSPRARKVNSGHHIYYNIIFYVVINYKTFVTYLVNLFLVLILYVLLKLSKYPDMSFQDFAIVSMNSFVFIPDSVTCFSMPSHSSSTVVTLLRMQIIFLSLTKS